MIPVAATVFVIIVALLAFTFCTSYFAVGALFALLRKRGKKPKGYKGAKSYVEYVRRFVDNPPVFKRRAVQPPVRAAPEKKYFIDFGQLGKHPISHEEIKDAKRQGLCVIDEWGEVQ